MVYAKYSLDDIFNMRIALNNIHSYSKQVGSPYFVSSQVDIETVLHTYIINGTAPKELYNLAVEYEKELDNLLEEEEKERGTSAIQG